VVIAISGFGMGFQSLEHRLVSHSGTGTADNEEGEARKGRKSKERRFLYERQRRQSRVRTDDVDDIIQKRE
jgi:hypothetical protein